MKKVTMLLVTLAFLSFQINAQKWVSTSPEKKKVVLEEFTGIHCGYCPDGHKRANDLVVAHPGKIILVNIHSGNFAVPSGSEPDFRTTEGDAIDDAAGVTGYPSGSVNRTKSPWGESRANWATTSATVLGQNSPVNVFTKAFVDFTSRKLTVEVEVYYTANSPQANNYLTVMLLQNNYLGVQSDYGNYNPTNWVNGLYRHNHILRQVITPTFGEKIDTTTNGHYLYRKYEVTLPAQIKNTDVLLYNLEVVAFVAESNANIYTGADAKVEFDENIKTDLALVDKTIKPSGLCLSSINPIIDVTNNMDKVITDFEVTATINGTPTTKVFSGSLAKNDKTSIDFGTITMNATGSYKVELSGFKNINGGTLYDIEFMNDNVSYEGIGFKSKAFSTINATFESSVNIPSNFAFDKKENPNFNLVYSTTTPYGAKSSKGAVRYSLHSSWNVADKPGYIMFGEAELSKLTSPYLTFYYAYSQDNYGGTAPTIKVEVSEDCGVNWTKINEFAATETGKPATAGNWYVPKSTEYVWVGNSLDAYKTKNILIRIAGIPGSAGNALYIDEISISNASSISDDISNVHVALYPNPAVDQAHLEFALTESTNVNVNVYNVLGELVISENKGIMSTGLHTSDINVTNLDKGIYVLHLNIGDQVYTRKFSVE